MAYTILKKTFCSLIAVAFFLSVIGPLSSAYAATQTFSDVINFSFETAGAAATDASNWTAFTAGGTVANRVTVAPGPIGAPFTTNGVASFYESDFGGNTSGVFQDVFGVTQGDNVVLESDARTPNMAGPPGDSSGFIRIEFYNQAGTQIGAKNSINITTANTGAAFARFSVQATAPANTSYARMVLSNQLDGGLGAGDIVFDNVSCMVTKQNLPGINQQWPISLSSPANNIEAWKGKLITVSVRVTNNTAVAIPAAELNVTCPYGLDIVRNSIQTDGMIIVPAKAGPNLTIPFRGALGIGETRFVTFQVLVTAAATIGRVYDVVLAARNPLSGAPMSNAVRIPVRIISDALFDQGTLIGKVFDDKNENGIQDPGELGIPNVRLATETGVVVYTDKDGKYHVPALEPNRHIIKIDGHSLPKGSKFVTEEKFLFKTTPGMLSKVSFAVKLPPGQVPEKYQKDLDVYVSQYFDETKPVLQISMTPGDLKLGQGVLEQNPVFRLETNYGSIIADWRLEVRNEFGELVWTGYGEGEPPSEVPWSGIGDNEKIIEPGDYSYRLIVADKDNHEDWTALQNFRVVSKVTGNGHRQDQPYSDAGFFNVMKDGKRSIPLTRQGAVMVRGNVKEGRGVTINNKKITPNSDGSFSEIVYLPYGKNNVVVSTTNNEGQTIHYSKELEVKDHYFFLVGLAEGELGYNAVKGSYITLGDNDRFRDAFYQNGRVAFYVKGKIKGNLLIQASTDTDNSKPSRNLSKLFTNLDPDAYYPVYGDASLLDYDAHDTQERFYILVESDRSFFKYGSMNTDFKETELVQYNRTLSGAKGHFETLTTTKYGDPKAGFTVMSAYARQAPDHNEFYGTGGSVYYLRHRLVIEGSDKLHIEVRDKIQNTPIVTRDLVEGEDYEIDYQAGRIIMYRPISSVTYTDTIINNEILNGNRLVLVADYEYETGSSFDFNALGARGWTHASDHIKVGGTYIRQTAPSTADDYFNRGIDGTFRVGENTKVIAEVADTASNPGGEAVSTDGGLSFINADPHPKINVQTGNRDRSAAWSLKGQTKIGKKTDLSAYYVVLNPGFAVPDMASQQNTRKYGIDARYHVTDHFQLRLRQDHLELVTRNNPMLRQNVFDPERQRTTTLQGIYNKGKWDVTTEYRHQNIDVQSQFRSVVNALDGGPFENAVGLKIGYQALEWFKPFMRGQVTMGREPNNQLGVGGEMRMIDDKTIGTVEEVVGNIGDGTLIGVQREVNDRTRVYTNFGVLNSRQGKQSVETTYGTSYILDNHSRVYTERRYTANQAIDLNQQNLLGYDIQLADRWNFAATFERSAIDEIATQADKQNAGSVTIAYNDQKRLQSASKFEIRYDETTIKTRQLLFQNSTQYRFNDDFTLKSRLNTSVTRNLSQDQNTGLFTEFNIGLAYRPVKYDRFSFLTKYTYLNDKGPDPQYNNVIPFDQSSHTIGVEGAYDLNRYLQMVQKLAIRSAAYDLSSGQNSIVDSYLWAPRFNFHVTRKWDLSLEYRMLLQDNAADDLQRGLLVEIDRLLADYVRFTVGYDFNHFNDGITPESGFNFNGFYTRLTGEF